MRTICFPRFGSEEPIEESIKDGSLSNLSLSQTVTQVFFSISKDTKSPQKSPHNLASLASFTKCENGDRNENETQELNATSSNKTLHKALLFL
jgi:hypothetical protein